MTKVTESRSSQQRDSYRIIEFWPRPPRRVWLEVALVVLALVIVALSFR